MGILSDSPGGSGFVDRPEDFPPIDHMSAYLDWCVECFEEFGLVDQRGGGSCGLCLGYFLLVFSL